MNYQRLCEICQTRTKFVPVLEGGKIQAHKIEGLTLILRIKMRCTDCKKEFSVEVPRVTIEQWGYGEKIDERVDERNGLFGKGRK